MIKSFLQSLVVILFLGNGIWGTVLSQNKSHAEVDNGRNKDKNNLYQIARTTQLLNQVHVIYFSASYCFYCKQLTEDVINAVRANKGYQNQVTITEIQIDGDDSVTDFNQKIVDPEAFASSYDIQITPTLIFVNSQGKEIVKRTVGYQNSEFYWYYFDKKIARAMTRLYSSH